MTARRDWQPIIQRARDLAETFVQRFGRPLTLRRLHYELVSDMSATAAGYANVLGDYKQLSAKTAELRRSGEFPDFAETVRYLSRERGFLNADELRAHIRAIARTDRMAGQSHAICVVVEKAGSRDFLHDWFDEYGVYVTALGGYSSQTLIDTIRRHQRRDKRPMVLLYAGDHDASGEDIDRDFQSRLGTEGIQVRRVALLPEHIEQYRLPRSPFDKLDTRGKSFIRRHGGLWQTELDALDPDVLEALFRFELERLWDMSIYQQQLELERQLVVDVLGEDADTAA
jgi:hypothetical protein